MTSLISPPRSPYMQLEFTAEEDVAGGTSDGEIDAQAPPSGSLEPGATARALQPVPGRDHRERPADTRPNALVVSAGAFFAALVLLVFITGFACRSFVFGILRILQEEFDFGGGETMAVVLSYDIGFVFVLIILTWQREIHRPRSIGFGGFLIGLGLLVVCIPYFIVRSEIATGDWYVSKHQLCDADIPLPHAGNRTVRDAPGVKGGDATDAAVDRGSMGWIVMGFVLCGIGAVPQFPMGITYMDDKRQGVGTAFYIGFLLCAYLLGIWCGELANLFMWQHVATATSATVAFWWLGFFVSALVALILGVFIFMAKDPYKRLVKETKGAKPVRQSGARYRRLGDAGDKQSKVQSRWRRLLTNAQLLCIVLGGSMEVALMTGFLLFLPRYMGSIASMGRGPSKFYIGTAVISSTCIGILTSSALTLHEAMKSDRLCRLVAGGSLVALLLLLPLYLFKCDDPNIAGNLRSGESSIATNSGSFLENVNVTMQCNAACQCDRLPYRPVCGSDGRTYLTSCLAGCHGDEESDVIDSQGLKLTNFTECSCVTPSEDAPSGRGYALSGPCASECTNNWPFLVPLFAGFFMTGTQFVPMILLSMRCVIRADRIVAISFQVITWHVLGYVPALVYFSAILNQSCILWNRPDAHNYHECALYDSKRHNVYFVSTAFLLKAIALAAYVIAYRVARKKRGAPPSMEWVDYDTIEMMDAPNTRPSHL